MQAFQRSEMLLGQAAMDRLSKAHVAVFGIGGVGSYATEALARGGVGALTLLDHDRVSGSNLNRQLIALHSTMGQLKVEVMARRIADINPAAQVHALPVFYTPEMAESFDLTGFDYVVDAIDTVSAKVALIVAAHKAGTPIISCMGAGNKLDPSAFALADLFETSGCPLARVLRKELRNRGVDRLQVVYSKELPRKPAPTKEETSRRTTPGSVSFVPPVAGLMAAGAVIRGLTGILTA